VRLTDVDLSAGEARAVRGLVLPDSDDERRLLVLVRRGRAVRAARTDSGPLPVPPPGAALGRERNGAERPERTLYIDLDDPPTSLLEGALRGSVRSDPPWMPGVERLRHLPRGVRRCLQALVPDGAFGLAVSDTNLVIGWRIRSGRIQTVKGGRALGRSGTFGPDRLVALLGRRLATPRLALVASERVVRAILASPRPVTALDRAAIRGDVVVAACSLRVRLALFVLRLVGL
jgi:hypothetical protein